MTTVVRGSGWVVVLLVAGVASEARQGSISAPATTPPPPSWAYPLNTPGVQPPADDGKPRTIPGSTASFLLAQTRDPFFAPDWYPDTHPPMPDVVARGRKPDVRACAFCHLANGQGKPENSPLAGLSVAYIAQQMADYKNGLRKGSEPKMGPPAGMIGIAKAASEEEVIIAAGYFASLRFQPWVKVVEADTVPKTRVQGWIHVPIADGGTEPIGTRVLETPTNHERTELRDSASGFTAYVPVGSIKKGEALVTTGGNGRTVRCGLCHGPELRGLGAVPAIAGRSPSYTARQLWDFKTGARNGPWAALMKEAVANLTEDDLVSIVAYTASRTP